MKKTVSLWGALAACVLCLLAGGAAVLLGIRLSVGSDGIALLQAQALIRSRFVGEYDPDLTRQTAEAAMVESLGDRWSRYLTPRQRQEIEDTRSNSYVGIGVTIMDDEQGLLVVGVNDAGPAAEAGIRVGEIICGVEGVPITSENRDAILDSIRGDPGDTVALDILDETGVRRTVELVLQTVPSVSASWTMLEDDVALLTLENFYTGAAEQVETCLTELKEEGARAMVIDVRNNPGGYVTELTDILDQLLPEGDIFRLTFYNGKEKVYSSGPEWVELPMAVLVNENSYSAAEFLAAQLRESVGAPLVGTRTCGKGYSQSLYTLRDGGAINLSDARYFTGGGTSLIGVGLKPDPYIGLCYARQVELLMGTLEPARDGQLQAALAALETDSDT